MIEYPDTRVNEWANLTGSQLDTYDAIYEVIDKVIDKAQVFAGTTEEYMRMLEQKKAKRNESDQRHWII